MLPINEQKKEWLLRYLYAKRRVNLVNEILSELCAVGASAITYDDMPKGSPTPHGLEVHAIRLESQYEAVRKAEAYRDQVFTELVDAINQLTDDTQKIVMTHRYINIQRTAYEQAHKQEGTRLLTWDEIAERTGYSIDRVTHVHGEALANLQLSRP